MIRAIIFDFFGVIYSDPYNAWLNNHGYIRGGEFLEASQKMDIGQIDMGEFFDLLSALSSQPAEAISKEFQSVNRIDYGVLKIITNLRENYKVGLLSNSPSDFIRGIIKENNLDKYFDEIVVSSEVGQIKPSKEIFDTIINSLGVKASEAIFIDDNKHYINGAEKAGLMSIQFLNMPQLVEDLIKVDIYE